MITSDYLIIALFGLNIVVIVFQVIERFYIIEQYKEQECKMLEEQSRLIKAIIAKNANDYVMTTSIDKVPAEEKPRLESDLIPEESLNDDEFMQAIHKDIKQ